MLQLYPEHKVTQQYRELAQEVVDRLEAIEEVEAVTLAAPQRQAEVVHG
jgi:hypothetical protein